MLNHGETTRHENRISMRNHRLRGIRAIVFDVGETLVDETRIWTAAAHTVGVTPFTLMAQLGSLIERGLDHRQVWSELGVEPPAFREPIKADDLYADAIPCLHRVQDLGFIIGVAGNQPEGAAEQLNALGFDADFVASSAGWGVEKPSSLFFEKVVEAAEVVAEHVLYVGDRLDNDVLPAQRAGMRSALLARGPWAHINTDHPSASKADLQLESLDQLPGTLE